MRYKPKSIQLAYKAPWWIYMLLHLVKPEYEEHEDLIGKYEVEYRDLFGVRYSFGLRIK